MLEQQEKIDEWEAYKARLEEVLTSSERDRGHYQRFMSRAPTEKKRLESELAILQAQSLSIYLPAERAEHQIPISSLQHQIHSLENSIAMVEEGLMRTNQRINWLRTAIQAADKKIAELKKQQAEEEQPTAQPSVVKQDPQSKCPKKCSISNIQLSWPEPVKGRAAVEKGKSKPITLKAVQGKTPTYEVIGSGETSNEHLKVIGVSFDGACDHGRSQSSGDSVEWKERKRYDGEELYCPKAFIHSSGGESLIIRPSKVLFNAHTPNSEVNENSLAYLFKRLVFGKDFDTTEFNLEFYTCAGVQPEKARIVAHPYRAWNFSGSLGYTASSEYNLLRKKNAGGKLENFNTVAESGSWACEIEFGRSYDDSSSNIKRTVEFEEFIGYIKDEWTFFRPLTNFLAPLLGFFESADAHNKGAEAIKVPVGARKIGKVDILWPKIVLEGKWENAEIDDHKVGGKGEIGISFDPLVGINGELDLIQFLLATAGGPFGSFLRYVSNLSLGKKDADGELIKTGNYFETKLSLLLGATSSLSGSFGWECSKKDGWNSKKDNKIGGKIVFSLKGEVAGEGKVWTVSFGIGAVFALAKESGSGDPGIEVDCTGVRINGKFTPQVKVDFNGLSVIWSVYKNAGVELAEKKKKDGKVKAEGLGQKIKKQVEHKTEDAGHYVFFSKKMLFETNNQASK